MHELHIVPVFLCWHSTLRLRREPFLALVTRPSQPAQTCALPVAVYHSYAQSINNSLLARGGTVASARGLGTKVILRCE